MKFIYTEELKKKIIKKFSLFYILLGEDLTLLNKNQKIILNIAKNKGFKETHIINIEQNKDWNKIIHVYNSNNLFFKKKILIINFIIRQFTSVLIKNINKLFLFKNEDILTIFRCNQLSDNFKNYLFTQKKILNHDVIWCFTPHGLYFKKWLKYEVKEKKLDITDNAFLLIYKYYKGNTVFTEHILKMIELIWKNENITSKKIKNIINIFAIFNPSDWINAIFKNQIKQSFYILDTFRKKKYNILILVRALQKDLLILLEIKREKKINMSIFFKKNNIPLHRIEFFTHAIQSINFNNFIKVIRILLQIDIKIKVEHNDDIWMELKTLILLLCSKSNEILIQ